MKNCALVVIDLQNDITKNYREIIEKVNCSIDWAEHNGLQIVYIRHNNLSAGTRTFKPGTRGAEFVPEMKIVSDNIFTKSKSNALTSEEFTAFIQKNDITEFYIVGADAAACIKSTCYNNLTKHNPNQRFGVFRRTLNHTASAQRAFATWYNMRKNGYTVHVISDCITSYDKKKIPEMLAYYESNGCEVTEFSEIIKK